MANDSPILDDTDKFIASRKAEIKTLKDLEGDENQRGTPIPALMSLMYKFVQNPSTVSVETTKRMVDTDDTVGSGIDFLTSCMAARLGAYQHPSAEITDFVQNRALGRVEGGFVNVVKEILSASWAGFSVSEKVWANDEDGFVPRKIVTLPPTSVLFEVDRNGSVTEDGVLQYQKNFAPLASMYGNGFFSSGGYGFGGSNRPDPYAKFGDLPFPIRAPSSHTYLSIRIPKLKTLHYAFGSAGRFSNPYGRSILRRAYKWWVMKDAFMKMMSIALDRKGTPLTVVFADPNTTLVDPNKAASYGANNMREDTPGITADVAARDAFKNIHNDSVIILPGKKDQIFSVDTVDSDSNAEVFIAAINLCNASILRALLIPSLIFMNGDGTGSYALGQEHAKTFDKILDSFLAGLIDVLIGQLVQEIIAYNYPESAWKKDGFGTFGKRELTQDERQKEAQTWQSAVNMGAIDMNDLNDLNKIREGLGFAPAKKPIVKPEDQNNEGGSDDDAE